MTNIMETVLKRKEQVEKDIAWWEENREAYEPLLDELEAAGAETALTSTVDVRATGNRDKLVEIMRILRRYGLEPTSRPEPNSPEYYSFWCSTESTPKYKKNFWLSFTSTFCRRVQVGTEFISVPKYEVHCGEGEPPITDEDLK